MDSASPSPIRRDGNSAPGKRRLIAAALRLAARSRSLHALGLRELAREAGLNPNTFYRHFRDIDELGLAIIDELVQGLRQPLRDQRYRAANKAAEQSAGIQTGDRPFHLERARTVTRETVALFFDYVLRHPDGFVIGVRELHGSSPRLREALRQTMEDFARDMAEDSLQLGLAPAGEAAALLLISQTIVRQMFELSLDYIEYPGLRAQTRGQAETMILTLFAGSFALRHM